MKVDINLDYVNVYQDSDILNEINSLTFCILFHRKYLQLRINKASSKDAGVYRCIATNVVGTTAKSVNIKGKISTK